MRSLNFSIKTKTLIFIAIFSVSGIWISGSIVHAVNEGGGSADISLYQKMKPSEKAASNIYYYALRHCVDQGYLAEGVNQDQLSGAGVNSGAWFKKASFFAAYVDLGYFIGTAGDSARSNCGDGGNWINTAYLSLWGYSDMVTALCETTGAQRWDQPRDKGCPTNPGLFTGSTERLGNYEPFGKVLTNKFSLSKFTSTIKSKVYGTAEPSSIRANGSESEKAAQYIEERTVLLTGCVGDARAKTVTSGENPNYLYNFTWVDPDGNSSQAMYYAGGTNGKKLDANITYLSGSGSDVTRTCSDLQTSVNTNSAAYISVSTSIGGDTVVTPPSGSGSGASPSATCGSTVTGIGWIVCPITTAVVGLNDAIWKLASDLLSINPITQSDAIYNAWNAIRSIANVLFVIFFLVIIFSQLTGAGITNYGIKKLLPRLIICAILVNISFVVIQIAVDLSNIAGIGLKNLLDGIATPALPTWGNLFQVAFNTVAVGAIGLAAFAIAPQAALLLLLPMVVMGLLGLMAALLTLIFRQAIIPILAILAPLAFVAYLLPNTEKWFKKWLDLLLPMLMLYPLAALVFGGARFAASLIVDGHKDNFILNLIGMIVLTAPLFSLPFLARQGGSILKAVQGGLSKLAENARAPLKNFAKERSDTAQANYLANGPQTGFGQRLNEIPGVGRAIGFNRNRARAVNKRKINRANAMEGDKAKFEKQVKENTTGNMRDNRPSPFTAQDRTDRRTGMGAYMYAHEQKTDNQAAGTEAENESGRRASGMGITDRLARAKDSGKKIGLAADIRQSQDPNHRQLRKEIANLESASGSEVAAIKHEAKTSITDDGTGTGGTLIGQQVAEREVEAETIASTDKTNASNRFNSDTDPTRLQIRADKREADQYGQSIQKQEEQLTTEASAGTAEGTAKAVAAGMSSASIAGLQHSKRSVDVATSATQSAQRAGSEEYEKAVAPIITIPVGGILPDGSTALVETKVIPDTSTAIAATGIGGSTDRVKAIAQQASDKRQSDEAVAQQILVEATADTAGKIKAAAAKMDAIFTGPDRDTEDGAVAAVAATQTLTHTGGKGRLDLREKVALLRSGDTSKAAEGFRGTMAKQGLKSSSASLDKHSVDGSHRSLKEIMTDGSTYSGLTIGELADQDDIEIQAAWACDGIDPGFAKNIIDHLDSYPKMTGEKLKIFTDVAAGRTPPMGYQAMILAKIGIT